MLWVRVMAKIAFTCDWANGLGRAIAVRSRRGTVAFAVRSVLAAGAVQLLLDRGPHQAEELSDAFLELGGFTNQRAIQLHFDVDAGTTGTVV